MDRNVKQMLDALVLSPFVNVYTKYSNCTQAANSWYGHKNEGTRFICWWQETDKWHCAACHVLLPLFHHLLIVFIFYERSINRSETTDKALRQEVSGTVHDIHVRFGALTVVTMKHIISRNVMPCSLAEVHRRFRHIYCLHLQGWRVSQASYEHHAGSKRGHK
jgi:hypothetical protein